MAYYTIPNSEKMKLYDTYAFYDRKGVLRLCNAFDCTAMQGIIEQFERGYKIRIKAVYNPCTNNVHLHFSENNKIAFEPDYTVPFISYIHLVDNIRKILDNNKIERIEENGYN